MYRRACLAIVAVCSVCCALGACGGDGRDAVDGERPASEPTGDGGMVTGTAAHTGMGAGAGADAGAGDGVPVDERGVPFTSMQVRVALRGEDGGFDELELTFECAQCCGGFTSETEQGPTLFTRDSRGGYPGCEWSDSHPLLDLSVGFRGASSEGELPVGELDLSQARDRERVSVSLSVTPKDPVAAGARAQSAFYSTAELAPIEPGATDAAPVVAAGRVRVQRFSKDPEAEKPVYMVSVHDVPMAVRIAHPDLSATATVDRAVLFYQGP